MRRLISSWLMLAFVLSFAATLSAQTARVVSGEVMDRTGKPWVGVTVTIKSETGQTFTLKTDKNGKYTQIGITPGIYTFTVSSPPDNFTYTEKRQIGTADETTEDFDFKTLLSQQTAQNAQNEEAQKKQQETANKFKEMQTHFNAGRAALDDADALHKQLLTAPADQKSSLQDKMKTDYQTAITELQQAEQGVQPKDAKNHAVVWANLGEAYRGAGQFDQAVDAYQKATDLAPSTAVYMNLSTALANSASQQTDPAALASKVTDAGAACDKATALDPTTTAKCWKNIGIVLTNTGHLPEAVTPLQKASDAAPKDAQTWFLLGGALSADITSKQEGTKLTYTFPPGLLDAYQKCMDADPTGPYAAQAKAALDGLNQLSGGVQTSVGEKPQKKKGKS